MTFAIFKSSLSGNQPSDKLHPLLQALWHDAKGDWHSAHQIAQDITTSEGAWIHGYLHRKEGDESNASYWYRQAGKKMPSLSLDEEWSSIAKTLLEDPA